MQLIQFWLALVPAIVPSPAYEPGAVPVGRERGGVGIVDHAVQADVWLEVEAHYGEAVERTVDGGRETVFTRHLISSTSLVPSFV